MKVQKVQKVQRGRFLGLTGPLGRRVPRFDSAFGAEGGGIALSGDEFYMPPYGGRENRTTAPAARWKCTPIPLRGLPPEGEVLAALCLEVLVSTKAKRRVKFPL